MDRSRASGLPCLPGYTISQPMAASYTKKQTLQYKNGYAVPVPLGQQEDTDVLQQQFESMWTIPAAPTAPAPAAAGASSFEPKYVQFDKKVLRFNGFFTEPVPDSPMEAWRARKVCVLLYLEDDSVAVTEPTQPNSGITQGTLVRRHNMPKEGGGLLGIDDLHVGASIKVYGHEVHIVDADAFTREFMAGSGIQLAPALAYPVNPIDEARAAKSKPSGLSRSDADSPSKFAEALLGKEYNSKSLQQFLQHGDEVLRFYIMWDDRQSPDGERSLFKLHFFVADSTAEIMEVQEHNSSKSEFPIFLRRTLLPKVLVGGALPGQTRLAPEQCYGPQDLRIGTTIAILGRKFFVHDCDEATRKWYTERLGFSPEMLAAIDIKEEKRTLAVPGLPPHNGFGSPEDSMQNCLKLIPKPAKRDPHRWAKLDHIVLRYEAVLEPAGEVGLIKMDRERRFVISYFMADQTLAVYEPVQPNTGLQGGKFLERGRVYKGGNKLAWYTEHDVRVGVVLDLHGRRFRLVAADAFTEEYARSTGATV